MAVSRIDGLAFHVILRCYAGGPGDQVSGSSGGLIGSVTKQAED